MNLFKWYVEGVDLAGAGPLVAERYFEVRDMIKPVLSLFELPMA